MVNKKNLARLFTSSGKNSDALKLFAVAGLLDDQFPNAPRRRKKSTAEIDGDDKEDDEEDEE